MLNGSFNDQLLFSAAGVGMYALDADGLIAAANPSATALLGWSPHELIGSPGHDLLHANGAAAECPIVGVSRNGITMSAELDTFRCADHTLMSVWWVAAPIWFGPEQSPAATRNELPSGVVVVFGDAERRHRSQISALAEAELARASLADARRVAKDLAWLADISLALTSTLDEYEALRRLARLVVPRLADIGIMDLLTAEGRLERVAGVPADGLRARLDALLDRPDVQHRSSDERTLALVRSGHTRHLSRDQMLDPDGVFDSPSRVLLDSLDAHDLIVVPMKARQHVLGVMALVRVCGESENGYSAEEITLAEDIGRRAGLALDNARLYHREAAASSMLQKALTPVLAPLKHVRPAARYRPAESRLDIGGDWYDVFPTADGLGAHLIVGDVTGHDLAAAAAMSTIRNILRGLAATLPDDPGTIVTAVDASLDTLRVEGTATCILMTASVGTNGQWELTWSSAGHPPPLVIDPDGTPTYLDRVLGPLLGGRVAGTRHTQTTALRAGSTILLYTDGLVETRGESIDVGLARLKATAASIAQLAADPEEFGDEILRRLAPSQDDDTVLLICHLPQA
ncbi:MAG: SpoIIE family protein phosphatase [Actinomycetota bacterium]|nr:SpoIIE family protein phosphatase [Actinomycetota bacterium]